VNKKALSIAFLSSVILGSLFFVAAAAPISIPSTMWAMTYGGPGADEARSVIQTSDGGYAIAGSTQSFGHGGWDMWLVKINTTGQVQWNQTYGSAFDEHGYQVIELNDGGYALAGTVNGTDLYMVRTNSTGNLVWALNYRSPQVTGFAIWGSTSSIVQTADGNFVLCGTKQKYGFVMVPMGDIAVIKVSASGQVLWENYYDILVNNGGNKIIQTSDLGFAVLGYAESTFGYFKETVLVKLDANGSFLWNNTFGDIGENAFSVLQTSDGGYAIAGYTSVGLGLNYFLIKTDSLGNQTWIKTYGGTNEYDLAYSLVQSNDGGYALAGYTNSFGAGSNDFWLVRTDSSGNMLWNNTYGGTGNDFAYSIVKTNDGGFVMAGSTNSSGAGNTDFFLIKIADLNPTPTVTPVPISTSTPTSQPTPTVKPSPSATSESASPNLTPSPTSIPEFSWVVILPLLASTLAVALFLKHQRVKKP
jgi:hypothetical protein